MIPITDGSPCLPIKPRGTAGSARGLALSQQVQTLLSKLHPAVTYERRRQERAALPFLLTLTPLDREGNTVCEDETVVVGKDLSERGLGFFHQQPLACRRAIIRLDDADAGSLSVEIDLSWCRFTRLGWYESGGRLIRAVEQFPAASSQAG